MNDQTLAILIKSIKRGKALGLGYNKICGILIKKGHKQQDVIDAIQFFSSQKAKMPADSRIQAEDKRNARVHGILFRRKEGISPSSSVNLPSKTDKTQIRIEDKISEIKEKKKEIEDEETELTKEEAMLLKDIDSITHNIKNINKQVYHSEIGKSIKAGTLDRTKEEFDKDIEMFKRTKREMRMEKVKGIFGIFSRKKKENASRNASKKDQAIALSREKREEAYPEDKMDKDVMRKLLLQEKEIERPAKLNLIQKSATKDERLILRTKEQERRNSLAQGSKSYNSPVSRLGGLAHQNQGKNQARR